MFIGDEEIPGPQVAPESMEIDLKYVPTVSIVTEKNTTWLPWDWILLNIGSRILCPYCMDPLELLPAKSIM